MSAGLAIKRSWVQLSPTVLSSTSETLWFAPQCSRQWDGQPRLWSCRHVYFTGYSDRRVTSLMPLWCSLVAATQRWCSTVWKVVLGCCEMFDLPSTTAGCDLLLASLGQPVFDSEPGFKDICQTVWCNQSYTMLCTIAFFCLCFFCWRWMCRSLVSGKGGLLVAAETIQRRRAITRFISCVWTANPLTIMFWLSYVDQSKTGSSCQHVSALMLILWFCLMWSLICRSGSRNSV